MSVFSAELTLRIAAVEPSTVTAFPELTARERDVLTLLGQRRSNSGIARELSLSEKTVRNNVSIVLAKLRVADREAAGVGARGSGVGWG